MTAPMMILALGSVFLGGILAWLGFSSWLAPSIGEVIEEHEPVLPVWAISALTLAFVILGVLVAYLQFVRQAVPVAAPRANALVKAARQDLYQDQINENLVVKPTMLVSRGLTVNDDVVVDGIVMGGAQGISKLGQLVTLIQNGYVRSYANTMLIGVAIILAIVLTVWI